MVNFSLKNFSFRYPGEEKNALNNLNLTVSSGEFIVISGRSGSGKSTLLSILKPELSPHGERQGEITFFGKESLSDRESAEKIGYLLQNTEYQTVTHSVRTELAFGVQNLGIEPSVIRQRIAEISAYFSLGKILDKKISVLSGGQKQLVCLASLLTMHPEVIILDEPASQLDPTAAKALFSTIRSLCTETGITVILTEHRLENVIPVADRLIVLDKGEIIADCPPGEIAPSLFQSNDFIKSSMPFPMRLLAQLKKTAPLPLDVADGKKAIREMLTKSETPLIPAEEKKKTGSPAIELKNLWFAYDKSGYVLKNLSLEIPEGSFYGILGGNAEGKSTALSLICGLLPLKSGKIRLFGKDIKKYKPSELYNDTVALLPQHPESIFSCNTLMEELEKALCDSHLSRAEREERLTEVARTTEISHLLGKHPYDVSGGEMQRAALAVILLKSPRIVLMDEPTKGTDALFKKQLASIIKALNAKGITVVTVSHDTVFCAEYCDRCAMISDGQVVSEGEKHSFFAENLFYTTPANMLIRDFCKNAVTESEVLELCKKSLTKVT